MSKARFIVGIIYLSRLTRPNHCSLKRIFSCPNMSCNIIQLMPLSSSKSCLLNTSHKDDTGDCNDSMSSFVDLVSQEITLKHQQKMSQIKEYIKVGLVEHKLPFSNIESNTTTVSEAISRPTSNNSRLDSAVEFFNINKLCKVAAMKGQTVGVNKLRKLAYYIHPTMYRRNMSLQHLLAEAEFYGGQQFEALDRIARLFNVSSHNLSKADSQSTKLPSCGIVIPKRIFHNKLESTTVFLLKKVPNVNNSLLWDQADELVQRISSDCQLPRPAATLWAAYLTSPLHADFARADALLTLDPVSVYVSMYLPHLLRNLLPQCGSAVVHHMLQQLMLYDVCYKVLPPVTSLLLSIYCNEGNSFAALETLHFSVDQKLPLTTNSLLRLQHLLYTRKMALPYQLLRLKYRLNDNRYQAQRKTQFEYLKYEF